MRRFTTARCMLVFTMALAMLGLAITQDLRAQANAPVRESRTEVTPTRTSPFTPHRTPADTGRTQWGHEDFSQYRSATLCDRAVESVRAEANRAHNNTFARDTAIYVPSADTLPSVVTAAAHTCGDQFLPDRVSPNELWSVARLAFITGDDARARTALARILNSTRGTTDSARVLLRAVRLAMFGSPPRLALSNEWIARLDALGPTALSARYRARLPLITYWHAVFVSDSVRAIANAAVKLQAAISATELDEIDDVTAPYTALFWSANLSQDFATQQTVLDTGATRLENWRGGQVKYVFSSFHTLLDAQRNLYGKPTRALKVPYDFNTGGLARPANGKLSLLVATDPGCGTPCYSLYAMLRRTHARYGDALDLTLLTETRGFAPGTGPLEPADEAKFDANYFLDFLKLPAAVLVDVSPTSRSADGRIIRESSPVGQMFAAWRWANALLVDTQGKIRWLGALQSSDDARMLDAVIERVRSTP